MSKRLFLRLGPSHVAAATRCIAETFSAQSRTDPFTSLFGFSAVHWADMVGPFVRRAGAAPRPLSVVSVDPQSGEVDGVMLNEDWTTGPPPEYLKLGSEWKATRAIFAALHQRYNDKSPTKPLQCLHTLYFTCVKPASRGQGVMKQLWHETVLTAQEEGFSHILAEAGTEDVRQVLSQNLGFREVSAVPFVTFAAEGMTFESLTRRDPVQFTRLSIMKRDVPSNLY